MLRKHRRPLLIGVVVTLALLAAGWHWQSELIGIAARWYLSRVAAREEASGDLSSRRAAVGRIHRVLLLSPPPDALVPELFDLLTGVSSRIATGAINFPWAAYVYTSYQRDLINQRPTGTPRRSLTEVNTEIERYVQFYALQRRPEESGVRLNTLAGRWSGSSYTVEEVEQAAREGRRLE